MFYNILIFRTDRIGDLLATCPTIITIKKYLKNNNITLITSKHAHSYAQDLNIFDQVHVFPTSNIISKIIFVYKLSKKKFDYIFVFDGKERSIISTALINSNYKVALTPKIKIYYKKFKIKFFADNEDTNLNEIFQKMINYCQIDSKINNYNFLDKKKDNNFSTNIPIKNYTHIHLDEKWFYDSYIKSFTKINPVYDEFVDLLNIISKENDILITTGIHDSGLIEQLKNNFFEKKNSKIFFKKNLDTSIYLVYKPTFDDMESLLRYSKILIACHGAITHAANSFNIKKIDILEENKIKFYKRFTSHFKNYHPIYRAKFESLKKNLLDII